MRYRHSNNSNKLNQMNSHKLSQRCFQQCMNFECELELSNNRNKFKYFQVKHYFFAYSNEKVFSSLAKLDKEFKLDNQSLARLEEEGNRRYKNMKLDVYFPIEISRKMNYQKNEFSKNICVFEIEIEKFTQYDYYHLFDDLNENFTNKEISFSLNGFIHGLTFYDSHLKIRISTNSLYHQIKNITRQLDNSNFDRKKLYFCRVPNNEFVSVFFAINNLKYEKISIKYILLEVPILCPILVHSQVKIYQNTKYLNQNVENLYSDCIIKKQIENFNSVDDLIHDKFQINNLRVNQNWFMSLSSTIRSFSDLTPFKIDQCKPYFYIKPIPRFDNEKNPFNNKESTFKKSHNEAVSELSIYKILREKGAILNVDKSHHDNITEMIKINEYKKSSNQILREEIQIAKNTNLLFFNSIYLNKSNFEIFEDNLKLLLKLQKKVEDLKLIDILTSIGKSCLFGLESILLYKNELVSINHFPTLSEFKVVIEENEIKQKITDEINKLKNLDENYIKNEGISSSISEKIFDYTIKNNLKIVAESDGRMFIYYYENKPWHLRLNFLSQIEELVESFELLKEILVNKHIHKESWFAILWTPVTPTKFQYLNTNFLTFYKTNIIKLDNSFDEIIPLIGIIPDKIEHSLWLNKNEFEMRCLIEEKIKLMNDTITSKSLQDYFEFENFFKTHRIKIDK